MQPDNTFTGEKFLFDLGLRVTVRQSENTQRIISYLSYLRDVSRKIVSRTGFEQCLLSKSEGCAVQFADLQTHIPKGEMFYDELRRYLRHTESNYDKKLFLGFGTVLGTRERMFAAPLLIAQCEISHNGEFVTLEPDIGTLSLNYDLISSLSPNSFNDTEDDAVNPLSDDENSAVEEYEQRIEGIDAFDMGRLNELAHEMFGEFTRKLESFKNIGKLTQASYNFQEELKKYTYRPARRKNTAITPIKRAESLFEKGLSFVDANHFFLHAIPDQLSTFEALNNFVRDIGTETEFKNPVVEKMLANALTDSRVEIGSEDNDAEIQQTIDTAVPLSLSNSQVQALKNAWANEISYIQGPPGTGKSHTISALVLSAAALHKKILVLSQKTAALKVVKDKIEPLLTNDGDSIIGICYYEPAARNRIREYCKYIQTVSNTASIEKEKQIIAHRIAELEKQLQTEQSFLESEKQKLAAALRNLREHNEANEKFLREKERFKTDFVRIPDKFEFKRIHNAEKYRETLKRVEKIEIADGGINTLSAKLYAHKFKEHLLTKFGVEENWIVGDRLHGFSHAFIELHILFTEAQRASARIKADTDSIRKRIKHTEEDIQRDQKELVKLKFKLNIFRLCSRREWWDEIDKLNSMLFNTNSRIIDKKMRQIDFAKITDAMPFWAAEIRNLGHLLPLQPNLFDLVVVDEASQVNLAEIIPAFYRGKRICIVGDHRQLSLKASGLSFSLSKKFDELTWEKYNKSFMPYASASKRNLTVTQASILDFFRSDAYQATIQEVLLDEHFRSLPGLARYTSRRFYRDEENPDGKLKIMTETPHNMEINCFQAVRVIGTRERDASGKTVSKAIRAEADETIKIIEDLTAPSTASKYTLPEHIGKAHFTIGVISMIRDQCELIKDLLREKYPNAELKAYGINPDSNEGVGTPEEFQGNERDIMIFTLCLDAESKGYGHYQDAKRLNVATSRARAFTYFVYSPPIPKAFDKIGSYLDYITKGNISNDDISPNDSSEPLRLPPFNPLESDFERYVCTYLEEYIKKTYSRDNRITLHNQINCCGQKRLDFVLYNHDTQKSVAIEVDGRHHFAANGLKENYTVEHIERMNVLTRAGWNIINTPYYKWYKDGWLAEEGNKDFKTEIDRIYAEIDSYIFPPAQGATGAH